MTMKRVTTIAALILAIGAAAPAGAQIQNSAQRACIIGVNKAIERPVVQHGQIAVRLMMNLSSSFDHRFVDGYDAAEIVQALKEMLEQPATIFIDG